MKVIEFTHKDAKRLVNVQQIVALIQDGTGNWVSFSDGMFLEGLSDVTFGALRTAMTEDAKVFTVTDNTTDKDKDK